MFVAKVEGQNVKIVDVKTGSVKRSISCSGYKGAKSADVSGDLASITCGDGKVRVYDINTGSLKRTI